MPKELEDRLKRTAEERGYSKERSDKYVYGTLAKLRKRRKEKSVG